MNVDELRIKNSGLQVNIIDLIVFDVIAGLLSDMRKLDCWQTVAQNDKFCRTSYSEILGNLKFRLQGIVNSPDSLRKRVDRLLELGLYEKFPNQRMLLLRPGANYNRLKRMHELSIEPQHNDVEMTVPTEAEVKAYFEENGLSDWKGFYDYNNSPKRQWTIGWNRAPMIEWHSFAQRWRNFGYGSKTSSPKKVAAVQNITLPLSLSEAEWQAKAADVQAQYKVSKLPDGSQIYVLKK